MHLWLSVRVPLLVAQGEYHSASHLLVSLHTRLIQPLDLFQHLLALLHLAELIIWCLLQQLQLAICPQLQALTLEEGVEMQQSKGQQALQLGSRAVGRYYLACAWYIAS